MKEIIGKYARDSLINYARERMCIIGGIGTGNLLKLDNKLFIITCRHVTDLFFNHKQLVITLKSNKKIEQENLYYFNHLHPKLILQ